MKGAFKECKSIPLFLFNVGNVGYVGYEGSKSI